MPAPRHTAEADLAHAARVVLLLALRPFPDGSASRLLDDEEEGTYAPLVLVERTDAHALATTLGAIGRNRFYAALGTLADLAASAAASVADDTGRAVEDVTPALRLTRHATRRDLLVVARYSDEDAAEDAVAAWDDHLTAACDADDVDALLATEDGTEDTALPLPASATEQGREALDDDDDDDDDEDVEPDEAPRVCPSCAETLPASAFRALRGATRYRLCRGCMTVARRDWRAANPDKVARYARDAIHNYTPRPSRGLRLF